MKLPRCFSRLAAASLLLVTFACDGGAQSPPPPAPAAQVAQAPASAPPSGSAPHSVPVVGPVTSRTAPAPAAGAKGGVLDAPGATFTLPADWVQETPNSSMRLAQAVIPGSGGPGQLTVFYFGPGGGGPVEDNIQRWIGQMEVASGTTPQRGDLSLDPFRISWVEVGGTLKPSTMGVGPTTAQPNFRMLGAVVEGQQGPWFFKATGPDKTMTEQRVAFMAMVRSAKANL